MAKIDQIVNNQNGLSVRASINEAIKNVEVDGTSVQGDGIDTPLSSPLAASALQPGDDQAEGLGGIYEEPADGVKKIFFMPFDGTVTETVTQSASGTCTAAFSINGTPLGGTANSVSSTEETQAHASANTFVKGDSVEITISSNAACVDMTFTINFNRVL